MEVTGKIVLHANFQKYVHTESVNLEFACGSLDKISEVPYFFKDL